VRTAAVLTLLVTVVGLMTPGDAMAFGTAREQPTYDSALALFSDGDHHGAVGELKRFLKTDPDHGAARLLVGRALIRVGRGQSAEEQLRRAAKLGANGDQLAVALARSYLLQQKFNQLLGEFSSRERAPNVEASLAYMRGLAYYAARRFDEADREFALTLAHGPRHVGALLGRIRIRIASHGLAEAESLVDEVMAFAPKTPDLWYLAGEIARHRIDTTGALAGYGKVLAITANHVPSRLARAAILIDAARVQEAAADIDAVGAIVPTDPQLALLRTLALAKTGKSTDAQFALRRLASTIDRRNEARREDGSPRILLDGAVNYARGSSDAALIALHRYLEFAPRHVGARVLISRVLAEQENYADAIAILRPALTSAPRDPELSMFLGELLLRAGRFVEATDVFEAALIKSPGSQALGRRLTLSRLAAGRDVASRAKIDDLLEAADPVRGGILIGLLQLGIRAHEAALTSSRSIAVLRPASPLAHNLAGIVQSRLGAADKASQHFMQA